MIAKRIETNRAKLDNPNKPIGVFMLCGPSGVGKTETALALAEALYGGEQNMITINMSEFQEAHTVSTLKGAPPGYVGYGEGGRLTEAVRRKPYSVILLDEVEKAHPDVHEIFFQVFDKGQMEDGTGRRIDFKNTLIILTSNVGTDMIMGLSRDPLYAATMPRRWRRRSGPNSCKAFPAALLGRIVTIPYYPLSDEMLGGIVRLQLDRIGKRIRENHDADFVYDDAVVDHIVSLCNDPDSGGRMIDNIITNTLLPALSREFLTRSLRKEPLTTARVSVENGDFVYRCNGDEPPGAAETSLSNPSRNPASRRNRRRAAGMLVNQAALAPTIIALWKKRGPDTLVKVAPLGTVPDPNLPVGYCTTLKFIVGRTPSQMEAVLGARAGQQVRGGSRRFDRRAPAGPRRVRAEGILAVSGRRPRRSCRRCHPSSLPAGPGCPSMEARRGLSIEAGAHRPGAARTGLRLRDQASAADRLTGGAPPAFLTSGRSRRRIPGPGPSASHRPGCPWTAASA